MASAGKVSPIAKGVWNSAVSYTRLDIVTNTTNTKAYIARKDNINTSLDNTEYWQVLVDVIDSADKVNYNNATSGLTATKVQAAIDEVAGKIKDFKTTAKNTTYDNTASGLTAADVQDALDELAGKEIDIDTAMSDTSTNAVQNKVIKKYVDDNKANKYTTESKTLSATNWVGSQAPYTYDLGLASTLDAEILLPNTATADEVEACVNAQIASNGTDNILRAWGDKPEIDIPIVIRKTLR